ncbi:DUF2093 domain-containing protein [Alterisphingorhabdus coralli]|uniref:DUF2093 domain-containing protein n=1 Tax=Alterisphingorhabdus coralli TaxID=3071408 RepID=A0AA97F904_9SPHN|nr:DUF2093 domain-containing protein [Parasphingorhabdus sp. SCSIO 66989]WOE75741.1 DUF2093 domain-containing protein [Parasphingorhabdus sp. SCSIO 66989]
MLLSNKNRMAKLQYLPGTFRIVSSGDHVVCAVSGERIPLEDLRYWSVDKQQPYATAEISVQAALAGAGQ